MTRYIGLDVHCASTTAAVVNAAGKRLGSEVLQTNGQSLVAFVKAQRKPVQVCLEEGTQAGWLVEVLTPHVQSVVVTAVTKRSGNKNDADDALELARRFAAGRIDKPIYKCAGSYTELKLLVSTHRQIVGDAVRMQNRIKATMRSRGISVTGKQIYSGKHRTSYVEQLPSSCHQSMDALYAALDALTEQRRALERAIAKQLERYPISSVLMSCPGIGVLRAAQLMATVVTPHRFRTKRQFWSYCGLAIVMRSSSDWVQQSDGQWVRAPKQRTCGLNLNHNRMLKFVFKGAAVTATDRRADNAFRRAYERLLKAGVKPNLARLTVARKLSATVLAMWKANEAYKEADIEAT